MKSLALILLLGALACQEGDGVTDSPDGPDGNGPPPPPPSGDFVWFDDFTGYSDEADFRSRFAQEAGGRRVAATGLAASCVNERIHLDPTGGPNGKTAMRYDYWDRSSDPTGDQNGSPGCGQSTPEDSYSLYYGRFWDVAVPGPSLWVRIVSKEGTVVDGFSIGCVNCSEPGGIYKFILDGFSSGPQLLGVQMTASGVDADPTTGQRLNWLGFGTQTCRIDYPGAGEWHTYVYGYDASDGYDQTRIEVWVDGQLVCDEVISISDPGGETNVKWGANMNSGPSQEQSRWFSEVGLYRSRPRVD